MYEIRLAESGALAVYQEGQQVFSTSTQEVFTRHCLKVSSLREAQTRIPTLYSSDHYPVVSWLTALKAAIQKAQPQPQSTPSVCPVVKPTSTRFKGNSGVL